MSSSTSSSHGNCPTIVPSRNSKRESKQRTCKPSDLQSGSRASLTARPPSSGYRKATEPSRTPDEVERLEQELNRRHRRPALLVTWRSEPPRSASSSSSSHKCSTAPPGCTSCWGAARAACSCSARSCCRCCSACTTWARRSRARARPGSPGPRASSPRPASSGSSPRPCPTTASRPTPRSPGTPARSCSRGTPTSTPRPSSPSSTFRWASAFFYRQYCTRGSSFSALGLIL